MGRRRCSRLAGCTARFVPRFLHSCGLDCDQIEWKSKRKEEKIPYRMLCTTPFTVFAYNIISNPISFGLLRDQTAAHGASSIVVYRVRHAAVPSDRVFVEETFRKEMRQKNGRTCHNYIFKIRFSRIRVTVYLHNGSTMMIDQPRFS